MSETFEKISAVLDGEAHATRKVEVQRFWAEEARNIKCVRAEDFDAHVTRLQAENAALQQRLNVADQRVDELQSELTKARELLGRVYDADLAARHHQPYNVSKVIDDIESFLAHQSAPAAKDGSDE